MKYLAKPVAVKALKIAAVDITLKNKKPFEAALTLEDGQVFTAHQAMMARYTPVEGDYVVWQEDGYVYLNPKEVFERKYRAVTDEEMIRLSDQDDSSKAFKKSALRMVEKLKDIAKEGGLDLENETAAITAKLVA